MITRNLWTSAGLTNGTMATVHEIGFSTAAQPGRSLPDVVMLACPDYRGPTDWRTASGVALVPVVPVTATRKKETVTCSRTQYPLKLAYAITIHKSQGMTVDKARIDLGESEFAPGITFVALSRVKRLDGILFNGALSWDRIRAAGLRAEEDEERRRGLSFSEFPRYAQSE